MVGLRPEEDCDSKRPSPLALLFLRGGKITALEIDFIGPRRHH
jgi:hypothetical protein